MSFKHELINIAFFGPIQYELSFPLGYSGCYDSMLSIGYSKSKATE